MLYLKLYNVTSLHYQSICTSDVDLKFQHALSTKTQKRLNHDNDSYAISFNKKYPLLSRRDFSGIYCLHPFHLLNKNNENNSKRSIYNCYIYILVNIRSW